jgi:hypothetical protein
MQQPAYASHNIRDVLFAALKMNFIAMSAAKHKEANLVCPVIKKRTQKKLLLLSVEVFSFLKGYANNGFKTDSTWFFNTSSAFSDSMNERPVTP